MYRCTECGTEYNTKPDYCDCGNDTFEEIKPAKAEPTPVPVKIKPTPKPKQPQPTKTTEKTSRSIPLPRVDALSLSIFLTCIVLSFIILFFVGNPEEKTVEEIEFEQTTLVNIPNIDNFWNNSTVGVVSDVQNTDSQKVAQPIQQIVQKVIPQTATPVQKVQTQKITTKTQTNAQKPAAAKKPATNNTTTPKTQNTPKIPQTTLNVTQNTPQTTTKPQTQTPTQTTQTTQQTQTSSAAAKQELANYKISLRNTIGRKIDFTKVVGDGSCAITFKVSSSGQLTDRVFAQQSSNITLNDAVFAAMKATPSFSAPPASYKNETLTLTIKFTNGNFAITLN